MACACAGPKGFGVALFAAELGETPSKAKILKWFSGAGILKLIDDYRGDTYRAVCTMRFATKVYVLQRLQKKSNHGIATTTGDRPYPGTTQMGGADLHQQSEGDLNEYNAQKKQ